MGTDMDTTFAFHETTEDEGAENRTSTFAGLTDSLLLPFGCIVYSENAKGLEREEKSETEDRERRLCFLSCQQEQNSIQPTMLLGVRTYIVSCMQTACMSIHHHVQCLSL